jgi:hypothetical protein
MNQSEMIRRIVEYRFPAWLAAVVVLGFILIIKVMTG